MHNAVAITCFRLLIAFIEYTVSNNVSN